MSQPTLLVIASTYPRWQGDPEPGFVHELSKRLLGRFKVIVLCPHSFGAKQGEVIEGVEVIRYRYSPERFELLVNDGGILANLKKNRWNFFLIPGFLLMQFFAAKRICRERNVDLIHAHWLIPQGLVASLINFGSAREIPFLVTSHGADLFALRSWCWRVIKKYVLNKSSRITVVSAPMRELVLQSGISKRKIDILSMGVDLVNRFVPSDLVRRSATEIIFVGRFVEKKGLRFLIDAFPKVLLGKPDVTLTVVGFGPEENRLKRQVHDLGLERAVHFLGALPQAELPPLYQRAALFVAPFVQAGSGDQEGLGLVTIEAIGCGCPVLAGDVPALSDVMNREWLVDVKNPDVLGQRILELVTDPVLLAKIANSQRESILLKYGWDGIASRYGLLLQDILNKR